MSAVIGFSEKREYRPVFETRTYPTFDQAAASIKRLERLNGETFIAFPTPKGWKVLPMHRFREGFAETYPHDQMVK